MNNEDLARNIMIKYGFRLDHESSAKTKLLLTKAIQEGREEGAKDLAKEIMELVKKEWKYHQRYEGEEVQPFIEVEFIQDFLRSKYKHHEVSVIL